MPEIREIKPRKRLPKLVFRVGIYCRVSSYHIEQIRTLPSQVSGMIDIVHQLPGHVLYNVYIDISSGANIDRPAYQEMMQDAREHKIDKVFTKGVSRLARDTVDLLSTVRELKSLGVEVSFFTDGIEVDQTPNDSELMLSIIAAYRQGENEKRSEQTLWGINASAENIDSPLYKRPCFGYIKNDDGDLVIVEDEADIVRKLFSLYLSGYSLVMLRKYLSDNGIASPRGRETWSLQAIDKLLSNEKYTGNVIFQKTFSVGIHQARKQNRGDKKRWLATGANSPIISQEVFDAVQNEKKRRSNRVTDDGGKTMMRQGYKYSGKKEIHREDDAHAESNSD